MYLAYFLFCFSLLSMFPMCYSEIYTLLRIDILRVLKKTYKIFIIVIKYLIFNQNIFHAYLFVIIFDYYTRIRNILIKLFINLRHIFLYKSNYLFTTNKRSSTLLFNNVGRLYVLIVSFKLWNYDFM